MNPARSALPASSRSPSWLRHCLAGLTWSGMALVALLCLINAVRRTVMDVLGSPGGGPDNIVWSAWILKTATTAASGLFVAVPVALAVVATYNLSPRNAALRYAALAMAVAVSSLAGVGALLLVESTGGDGEPLTAAFFLQTWVRYSLLCALFTVVFVYLRIADESAARAQDAERDRARFVARTQHARLKMLQAQIEPHFLFNTLANVRRLYQTEPADGEAMLDSLMHYFEVALPQMRSDDSSLGRETDLATSYLEIQRIRMGRRLAFDVDIAAPLRDASLPPLMLLTLVENAIKHGLAPLPEGGRVRISAAVNGNELEVRVADTGQGFTQSSGGGTGLANIRARLAAMYGAAGRLALSHNAPRGVTATIALPLALPPSAGGA